MKKSGIFAKSKVFVCIGAVSISVFLGACSPKPNDKSEDNASPAIPKQILKKESYLTRNIQDEVFYFVMPDRFHNANLDNDNGDPNRPISYGGLDTASKWAFHGGDISGVEAKLDYIQGLGITSIWMTPILRNRAIQNDGFAHHGYWVVDFTEIDPHFGSNDDLKSLIDAAHKRDIKVFFDIITNHTADVIKYKECHKPNGDFLLAEQTKCEFISSDELSDDNKYTPFLLENEKDVKVPAWLNDPKYYNNQGDSFWQGESAVKGDFVGLDDIDTSQIEVIEGLTDVFKNLIDEFKPDGFRIDTVKHVDIEFWQSFGPAIVEHAQSIGIPQFFIFGEVYDGNPAGLSKFTTTGKLPSVLDFSFAFNANDVVFQNKAISQLENLFNNDDYYRDHDSTPNDLLNFLGNHDMGRVGHFIEKNLPGISEDEKLARNKIAHALMYFSRGVPVVYYGDEQGFTGDGGDVDARENMDPSNVESYNDNNLIGTNSTTAESNFDTQHPLYKSLVELARVRSQHITLRRGEHHNRLVDEDKRVYGFSRVLVDETGISDYLVLLNFSDKAQQIRLEHPNMPYQEIDISGLNSSTKITNSEIQVSLAPFTYTIFKANSDLLFSNISALKIGQKYQDNERTFVPIELNFAQTTGFNNARIDIYDNTIEASPKLIGFDTTYPYRAVLTSAQAQNIKAIKVIANNYNGQTVEAKQVFTMQ